MHSSRMLTALGDSRPRGGGGVCLNACWGTPSVLAWRPPMCGPVDPLGVGLDIPQVWVWRPQRSGPGDPPGQTPQLPPLGCGPEDPPPTGDLQGMLGYHLQGLPGYHPQDLLQGMLGYHLQCMLGYHPPAVDRIPDIRY